MKFDIGDFVEAKDMIIHKMVSGFIMWIQPAGAGRIMIRGCGCLFRPEEVKLKWFDVDTSEFE